MGRRKLTRILLEAGATQDCTNKVSIQPFSIVRDIPHWSYLFEYQVKYIWTQRRISETYLN